MPADPSIYSLIRPPAPVEGPLDSYAKMISVRHMLDTSALNELQRTKLTRDLEEEQGVRDLYRGATPEQMSAPEFMQRVMGVSPTRGVQLQKTQLDNKKAQAEIRKADLEAHASAAKQYRDFIASETPQNYDAAKSREVAAQLFGPEVAAKMDIPPSFDAARQESRLATGEQYLQKIEKAKDRDLTREGHAEIKRHHGVEEANAAATRKIAAANLGIHAATADPMNLLGLRDVAAGAAGGGGGTIPASSLLTGAPAAPRPAAPVASASPAPSAPTSPAAAPGATRGIDMTLTGEDFLKQLPPGVQSQIKGLAEGRLALGNNIRSNPVAQQLIQLTAQYDPTFDATDYSRRNRTAIGFAVGKQGDAVRAANQTVAHAGSLFDAIDKLNNTGVLPSIVNPVINAVEEHGMGDSRQGVFRQKVQAVASELRKVFAGSGGGSLEELKKWEASIPENASKQQQQDYLRSGLELLKGSLDALENQYQSGMGAHRSIYGDNKLVTKKSMDTLKRIMGEESAQTSSGKVAEAPQPRKVNSLPDPAQHAGWTATGDDGVTYLSDGKKWVRK